MNIFDLFVDLDFEIRMYLFRLYTIEYFDSMKIGFRNYYKHLQSTGCFHMKELKKAGKVERLVQEQHHQLAVPLSSLTDSSPQQLTTKSQPTVVPSVPHPTTSNIISSDSSIQSQGTRKRPSTSQSRSNGLNKRNRI